MRDNGIGIAPEQLPRVFEMFTQVDTSLERSHDGLGIGLTLVKTLVEMHGGTVEARSDGPGRGSEFVVRLPMAANEARPASAAAVPRTPAATGRRVLSSTTTRTARSRLAMMLRIGGHETQTAHDGLQAIAAAERFRPDAMLLDIGLPSLNGYEVCRRIRQQPWGKDLLLVAVTGWGQEEDRQRSNEAGFDTHVVKPVKPAAILQLLASFTPGQRSS